eukprot:symbB.v1.2.032479.t2/scaffold3904.1/size48501/1
MWKEGSRTAALKQIEVALRLVSQPEDLLALQDSILREVEAGPSRSSSKTSGPGLVLPQMPSRSVSPCATPTPGSRVATPPPVRTPSRTSQASQTRAPSTGSQRGTRKRSSSRTGKLPAMPAHVARAFAVFGDEDIIISEGPSTILSWSKLRRRRIPIVQWIFGDSWSPRNLLREKYDNKCGFYRHISTLRLRHTQVLVRGGARTPLEPLEPESFWRSTLPNDTLLRRHSILNPDGGARRKVRLESLWNQLTLRGMDESYALGRRIETWIFEQLGCLKNWKKI